MDILFFMLMELLDIPHMPPTFDSLWFSGKSFALDTRRPRFSIHCSLATRLWVFPFSLQLSSVQSLSHVRLFAAPWVAARQASLSITNSRSPLRLMSIESVMPSSHLILCRPLLLLPQSLPASESFPMSQLFAWGGQSIGVSALASLSFQRTPRTISLRMDWLDLLAVQGTLKSLLQHHTSKASFLRCSAFFIVQL